MPNPDKIVPLGFFVHGQPYKLWGLFESDIHLLGPTDPKEVAYMFGLDRLGRDLEMSRPSTEPAFPGRSPRRRRHPAAARGLFGGISGYYGGWIDRRDPYVSSRC